MEQFHQITLDEWMGMKAKLQAELLGVKRSFVRIGYLLRKVDETEGYKNDGYGSITEWAKGEYDMEASTVSRFMSINREFSIGGYSEQLLPEFEDFKRSQLEEMLKLPAADRTMITPETPRADIRELKSFNKIKAEGTADDTADFLEKFLEEKREMALNCERQCWRTEDVKEIIIPSGNGSYRKGSYILLANEQKVNIKKAGQAPESFEWDTFVEMLCRVYADMPGQNQEQEDAENKGEEYEDNGRREEPAAEYDGSDDGISKGEDEGGTEFAESCESDGDSGRCDEVEDEGDQPAAGNMEEKTEAPEVEEKSEEKEEVAASCAGTKMAETLNEEPLEDEEKETVQTMTRKNYLDNLNIGKAAEYIAGEIREKRLIPERLSSKTYTEKWLGTMINVRGE